MNECMMMMWNFTRDWFDDKSHLEKGMWRIGRAPDRLTSHACIPDSNPFDPAWVFPFSTWLDDHGDGGLVD